MIKYIEKRIIQKFTKDVDKCQDPVDLMYVASYERVLSPNTLKILKMLGYFHVFNRNYIHMTYKFVSLMAKCRLALMRRINF